MKINTKNIIKIPYNISIFYHTEKKAMIIKGPKSKNFLKLNVEIIIRKKEREILISAMSSVKKNQKLLKHLQGTTTAIIKQFMYGTLTNICVKTILVGIGYKALYYEDLNNILQFRLGFSHSLFFRIPTLIKIICLKSTKLFIYGSSYFDATQAALTIRRKKIPEPYKGKGIIYENEKIILKKGKKV